MKTRFRDKLCGSTILIILLFSIWSCKKYTQVDPISQYTIPQVFSDVSNATAAVLGIYDELQGDNGYGIRLSMYYPYDSDEGIVSGNLDNGRRGIGRYQLLLSNSELRNPWVQLYRGVEKANLCIEHIPTMDLYTNGSEAEKKRITPFACRGFNPCGCLNSRFLPPRLLRIKFHQQDQA